MRSFCYFCEYCGAVVCRWCSRSSLLLHHTDSMVKVILWAENGVVPFKSDRRAVVQQRLDELEEVNAN